MTKEITKTEELVVPGGVRLLEDTKTHEYRMQVKSSGSGNMYTISRTRLNKIWACSCMGFIRHRHCKHLDTVLPALKQANPKKQLGK